MFFAPFQVAPVPSSASPAPQRVWSFFFGGGGNGPDRNGNRSGGCEELRWEEERKRWNYQVQNVKLLDRYEGKKPINGILYLMATHLIYVEEGSCAAFRKETWIPLHHIATVEKLSSTTMGYPLVLHLSPEDLYAFSYNPKTSKGARENGWKLIDPVSDFERMGIPNRYWTITDANKNYEICSTYPPDLVVPRSISLDTVIASSKFRSRERVPVLSYFYKENNATICRCSQPLCGFYARCIDDEFLLDSISRANPGSKFMYVVDTRPKLNAMANRAAGKGYENEVNYTNIRFRFLGIENIHVMRNSLQKLLEVCELKNPTMSEFLVGLESSGWLRHIKSIMEAGIFITKAVEEEKASVLVHCSDGWDRTSQVCSVASIILDPFYRTFEGLMILIEKEWISMGHKFSERCGHLEGDSREVSPIFTQFLDCVWQLMEQFPCAFEFNENFLLEIHDHIFSCQFGNFLGNCPKDREDLRVVDKTHSLWPFLIQKKEEFRNPLCKGTTKYGVLHPSVLPYNIQFWCGMYNRFDKGLHPKQSIIERLLEMTKEKTMLKARVHELEKKLKSHGELLEEDIYTCPDSGDALSQHLGSPLTNPLGFMGSEGDLNTLMENRTLSREGGLRAQVDQAKDQCGEPHPDSCKVMDKLGAIDISGDVDISGSMNVSEDTDISKDIEIHGFLDISESWGFCEDILPEGVVISQAKDNIKETGYFDKK
ncbi:myotubularin-related protein 8 isoform X2 [Perognathus longimembris pacificus]|uniref:myotubularin-related protein 8 isoform X2 n=1 Tax=Perognathus longimembris pacificus TaxID=214514 RepID=UPI0020193263|nr:myotubularin-related protein 8 isoform X2 [Perognathus longimembris pacificus]